jgi:hypothetical protein
VAACALAASALALVSSDPTRRTSSDIMVWSSWLRFLGLSPATGGIAPASPPGGGGGGIAPASPPGGGGGSAASAPGGGTAPASPPGIPGMGPAPGPPPASLARICSIWSGLRPSFSRNARSIIGVYSEKATVVTGYS